MSLRVKKYFIEMSLSSPAMKRVGALLERQADVDAERVLAAGAFEARGHDPGAGARDDHPALRRHVLGEVAGLRVGGVGRQRPRRSEDRDLRDVAIRRERAERARISFSVALVILRSSRSA